MSTYRGEDDCTDVILDWIADKESFGNYNAVIGNAYASNDLSLLTIGQIYDLQTRLVADHKPSSAVGRYQIIKRTLQALVSKKGLDTAAARFTPRLQDQLAVALLVTRGYMQWWDGEMSDQDFLHNLSMEWASLPDPARGGKSHYDGDGVNHAGHTLNHCYEILSAARGHRGAPESAKASPATTLPPPEPNSAPTDSVGPLAAILNTVKGFFS